MQIVDRDGQFVRMQRALLWLLAGTVWWLSCHTLTVLIPLAGPWLPVEAAVPVGLLMAILAIFLGRQRRGWLIFVVVGFCAGAYLGWVFARGDLADGGHFLRPGRLHLLLSVVVCGVLGIVANTGMLWSMHIAGGKPLRFFSLLLLLLVVLLGAVAVTAYLHDGRG